MTQTTARARSVRLAIVEDEALYRELLCTALETQPRLEVVGCFGDPEQALQIIPELEVDVVILDIELGAAVNGIQLGLLLRQRLPRLGILLLSNHADPAFLSALPGKTNAGWSYLIKSSVADLATLERALTASAQGLVVLDPQIVARMHPREGGRWADLTPRERELLGLIVQGFSNRAIATHLGLAEKTVENQISLLYQTLGVGRGHPNLHPRVETVLRYLREHRHLPEPPAARRP